MSQPWKLNRVFLACAMGDHENCIQHVAGVDQKSGPFEEHCTCECGHEKKVETWLDEERS